MVDSKLAVILLQLIKVDADESAEVAYEHMMEVFARLDVAMAVAVAEAAAAVEATLWAALIFFLPITKIHAQQINIVQVLHPPNVIIVMV